MIKQFLTRVLNIELKIYDTGTLPTFKILILNNQNYKL